MSDSNGLSPLQFTLITGTFLIANLAAFWFIRRNFFKSADSSSSSSSTATSSKTGKDGILSVEEWSEFELIEKEVVTHNTAIYRFALPTNESILPIPIGQVFFAFYIRYFNIKFALLAHSIGSYLE
jgi:hypothetical protein